MLFRERAWQAEILRLSYHDSLTGLYNRRYLEEQLEKIEMQGIVPLAVIIADVNGLKLTNDVFGTRKGTGFL